jgi:hypothetical protein
MNVLEKILEEKEIVAIKELIEENEKCFNHCEGACCSVKSGICNCDDGVIVQAIHKMKKYLELANDTNVPSKNGWIPVSEKLPEVGKMVKVTVHSSEWIADYDSAWVPEEEQTYHPEEYSVYDGYLSRTGEWRFYDEQYSENTCAKEFGTDKGTVYDVVTAWMPKEQIKPYKEE